MNKKKAIRLTLIAVAATGSLTAGQILAPIAAYDLAFKRYDRPDYSIYPGEYCFDRVKDRLQREELFFDSDNVKLKGYYYPSEQSKGLVVICHGLHSGADDYLPAAEYFVSHGYNVFGFDYKGTYDSEGDDTVGMCESLVDLDHALDYIAGTPRFNEQPLFLFGHSWGGYAVTSISAIKDNVKAVAAIAPMNDGFNMIVEKGSEYVGDIAKIHKPVLSLYQKELFGKYCDYNGVKGINARMIPYIIAQGTSDKVVTLAKTSVAAHQDEIINPYVDYYFKDGDEGGHDHIWHSKEATKYRIEVDAKMKTLKKDKEALKEYVASVDHHLYSETNEELFEKIVNMFDNQLL